MSNLRIITGKYLEEKLKKGHRLNYFLNVTGSSEDELFDHIDKIFSSKAAKSFKRRLKSKGNSQKKAKKNTTNRKPEEAERIVEVTTVTETNQETGKTLLEQLLEEEELLSSEVCQDEAEHSRKISERAVLKNQLIKQRKQMQEIAEKCLQVQQAFEETVSQWNAIGNEMKSLSSSISEKRTTLEEIRSEIDSLKKISMFVYSNGEIEFKNQGNFSPIVDTEKVSEIFSMLVQNESAECLTIKSIKQLARVLAIVEKLKDESMKFLIEFDETAMKEVFDIVSQN